MATWFENLINNGEFILRCPFSECKRPLSRSELENILSSELLEKIDRFEELSGKNKRECPFCGYIQVGNPDKVKSKFSYLYTVILLITNAPLEHLKIIHVCILVRTRETCLIFKFALSKQNGANLERTFTAVVYFS